MARELNDQTSQALSSLVVGLAAVESGSDQGRLPELRALASRTLGEIHDMSFALRPSVLEDLGLAPALEAMCQALADRFTVQVECVTIGIEGVNRLPSEIEIVLFRIIQAAATAAVQHAKARSADVLVQHKTTSVLAVIEHDGIRLREGDWRAQCLSGDNVDLLAIEKRARMMDGTVQIESTPGARSSEYIELPLPNS
jgi:signal transduction histidine kinase